MSPEFLGLALALGVLAALLVAIPLWQAGGAGGSARNRVGAVATLLLLPLAVLSLYTQVSSYPWDNPERLTAPPPGAAPGPEQIQAMVDGLAARMAEEPTVEGLTMLGRSYATLQRFEDAVQAYHQAWEMTGGEDPGVSLAYAEALLLADRNSILTSAGDLLDSVLQQAPDSPKALWYGGMSSIARGRADEGRERLVRLLNQPDIPDELRQVVQQQLAALTEPQP